MISALLDSSSIKFPRQQQVCSLHSTVFSSFRFFMIEGILSTQRSKAKRCLCFFEALSCPLMDCWLLFQTNQWFPRPSKTVLVARPGQQDQKATLHYALLNIKIEMKNGFDAIKTNHAGPFLVVRTACGDQISPIYFFEGESEYIAFFFSCSATPLI